MTGKGKPHTMRNAHVLPGLPRARAAEATLAVRLSAGTHDQAGVVDLGPEVMHDAEAHRVISAELVACTLGQRQRLELRRDMAGRIGHALISLRRGLFRLLA